MPDGPGFRGIVDNDYVAARVAVDIDAQMLVILTDVPSVMSNFGTPSQELLKTLRIQDIERNRYPDGSIAPKVMAAADFVPASGGRALIGSLDNPKAIMNEKSGTEILWPGSTSSS